MRFKTEFKSLEQVSKAWEIFGKSTNMTQMEISPPNNDGKMYLMFTIVGINGTSGLPGSFKEATIFNQLQNDGWTVIGYTELKKFEKDLKDYKIGDNIVVKSGNTGKIIDIFMDNGMMIEVSKENDYEGEGELIFTNGNWSSYISFPLSKRDE